MILDEFWLSWWLFGFDYGWVSIMVRGWRLEVGGDELKKFRPWRFREKQKERGRKNKK